MAASWADTVSVSTVLVPTAHCAATTAITANAPTAPDIATTDTTAAAITATASAAPAIATATAATTADAGGTATTAADAAAAARVCDRSSNKTCKAEDGSEGDEVTTHGKSPEKEWGPRGRSAALRS